MFSLRPAEGRLLIIILLPPQVYLILSQMSSERMRGAYNNYNHNNLVCYYIHTLLTFRSRTNTLFQLLRKYFCVLKLAELLEISRGRIYRQRWNV